MLSASEQLPDFATFQLQYLPEQRAPDRPLVLDMYELGQPLLSISIYVSSLPGWALKAIDFYIQASPTVLLCAAGPAKISIHTLATHTNRQKFTIRRLNGTLAGKIKSLPGKIVKKSTLQGVVSNGE